MVLDHLVISSAVSFWSLSSVFKEDSDVSTYWNGWGYRYYDEEPEQECVEQPYLDSMYHVYSMSFHLHTFDIKR